MNIFKKIWPLFLVVACFCIIFLKKEVKKPVRVYVDVVGDLFHSGHVEFFKKARALGDYLIVGVISDETAISYKRQPLMTLEERARVIESCRFVDEVIRDCPLGVTKELIEKYNIDFVVHGDDFDAEQAQAQYGPAIEKNIMRFVTYTEGISSTELIDRVVDRHKRSPQGLQKK